MDAVAFTICAANYLHHAVTLGRSLMLVEPHVRFVIGIIDDNPVPYTPGMKDYHVIRWSELRAAGQPPVSGEYGIVEFCTAVKPAYFLHLMNVYPEADAFYYIDPDIRFYGSLQEIASELEGANVVLTPHALLPQSDGHTPITPEVRFLMRGVFNLGFIGVRRSSEAVRFLRWWSERLMTQCLIRPEKGLFVDQKWIDLAPCFFEGVCITRHPGCNVAYWNLYERELTCTGDQFESNGVPLVFYHFSAMDRAHPAKTVARFADLGYGDIEALARLHLEYAKELQENGRDHYSRMAWHRPDGPQTHRRVSLAQRLLGQLNTRMK